MEKEERGYKWRKWSYSTKKLRYIMDNILFKSVFSYLWRNRIRRNKDTKFIFNKFNCDDNDLLCCIETKRAAKWLGCSVRHLNKYLKGFRTIKLIEYLGQTRHAGYMTVFRVGHIYYGKNEKGKTFRQERSFLTKKKKAEIENFSRFLI